MGFSGALLALSAVKGVTDISKGYAQSAEDKYNASLASGQANLFNIQGDIQQGQITRQGGQIASRQTAIAGASGIQHTGSMAAVMLDTQTKINTDKAIAKFNTQSNVNYANATANQYKIKASQAVTSGYASAFSDLLSGATNYGMYKYNPNQKKTTFDISGGAKQSSGYSANWGSGQFNPGF